jgi:hypothetical protein
MAHWNHRIIKRKFDGVSKEEQYGIYEVFYNNDGSINAYTVDPVSVASDSLEGLKEILEWMMNSLNTPVLIYDEIECIDLDNDTEVDR